VDVEPIPCQEGKLSSFEKYIGNCRAAPIAVDDVRGLKECMQEMGNHALGEYVFLATAHRLHIPFTDVSVNLLARDDDGTTLLCYAVGEENPEIIRYLVDKKIFPSNTATSRGLTPLMVAAREGSAPLLKALLDQRAKVNARDGKWLTALMYAAARGHDGIVVTLLKNFADPQAKDKEGKTPLFYACINGHEKVVRMLEGSARSDMDFAGLAIFYAMAGKQSLAQKHIDTSLGINPRNGLAWFVQGKIHETSGNPEKAVAALTKAVSFDPQNPKFWYHLAIGYHAGGDYTRAMESIRKAVLLEPDDAGMHMLKAQLYLLQGDLLAAQPVYEKAGQLQLKSLEVDKSAENFARASWYSLFAGDFSAAETSARKSLNIDASLNDADRNLGHALLFQGRKNEALLEYRRFLQSSPGKGMETLREDLALLRKRYPKSMSLILWAERQLQEGK
jgi:tetratricopeptide (TPR) repeat protein